MEKTKEKERMKSENNGRGGVFYTSKIQNLIRLKALPPIEQPADSPPEESEVLVKAVDG